MRPHGTAVCLLVLAAALAGCGDDEARAGVRVRILTSALDGPVQGRLKIQSVDAEDATVYELEQLHEGDPDLYIGPGAPPGRYRVFSDASWGMLWYGGMGAQVPRLRGAGEPVAPVRMGRPRTVYVAPQDPKFWQLAAEPWGADCKPASDPKGGFRTVPAEVRLDPEGIVSLRFRPEDWKPGNVLRILGQMTSGHVTNLLSFVVTDLYDPNLPRLAMVHGAPHAPLRLVLVPPPGTQQVPDGARATLTLLAMPFPGVYEERSHRGVIRFDGVAALGGGLRVTLPGSGEHAVWDLGANDWRISGGMFLVAIDPEKALRIPLDRSKDPVVAAYVRYPRGASYARLPLIDQSDIDPPAYLLTHTGPQEWLLKTAAGAWHRHQADVTPGEHSHPSPALSPPEKGCRMKGSVRGAGLGYRVDFRPHTEDGFVAGFTAAVSPTAEYEVSLPPGRVEIQVIGPTGGKSAPVTMDLRPGQSVRRDLSPR